MKNSTVSRPTRNMRFVTALCLALLVVCALPAFAAAAELRVGSLEPYTTLADAIGAAASGDTIVVTESMTLTSRAYIMDKHLTIKGSTPGITLTRGNPFAAASDVARGWFNSGLVEVALSDPSNTALSASVRFENIIFDDANNPQGFSNTTPGGSIADGSGWGARLYDSVFSAYTARTAIIMGPGAEIHNSGALYTIVTSSGASVTLEPGSKISGGTAGRVVIRSFGGTVNFGATITAADALVGGTLIHADGATAQVNFTGTISGGTYGGNALLLVGAGTATVSGEISDASFGGSAIYILNGATLNFSGKILGNTFTDYLADAQALKVAGNGNTVDLAAGSKISENTVRVGAVYVSGNNGTDTVLHFRGEISDNTTLSDNGGAAYLIYGVKAYVYNTAKITGNTVNYTPLTADGGGGGGGGFYLNYNTSLTMSGGLISGNTASGPWPILGNIDTAYEGGGGVMLVRNSQFIMTGGVIENNTAVIGGGVYVSAKDSNVTIAGPAPVTRGPSFIFTGGTIRDNIATGIGANNNAYGNNVAVGPAMTTTKPSTATTGHFVLVGKNAVLGDSYLALSAGQTIFGYNVLTGFRNAVYPLDAANADMSIGTLLPARETAIATDAIAAHAGYARRSSFWFDTTKTSGTSSFTLTYPTAIPTAERNQYEYLFAYQPLDGLANPLSGSAVAFKVPTREAQGLKTAIPLTAAAEGYGVVLLTLQKTAPLIVDLTKSGSGTFFDAQTGGALTSIEVTPGVSRVLKVEPASGWKLKKIVLTAGDGSVYNLELSQEGTVTIDYYQLSAGTNTIHAVFEKIVKPLVPTVDKPPVIPPRPALVPPKPKTKPKKTPKPKPAPVVKPKSLHTGDATSGAVLVFAIIAATATIVVVTRKHAHD